MELGFELKLPLIFDILIYVWGFGFCCCCFSKWRYFQSLSKQKEIKITGLAGRGLLSLFYRWKNCPPYWADDETTASCHNMAGGGDHYVKGSKPGTDKYCMILLICEI